MSARGLDKDFMMCLTLEINHVLSSMYMCS